MPMVAANGLELYYEDGGQGAPLVYIHGGFASLDTTLCDLTPFAWTWENDFAAAFHFIEYDRRGCFRSSCPEGGYGLPNQVRDLECLLDHLSITSTHIIGSSAGGPIAILFAATRPQRVRSLTLAGTSVSLFRGADHISDLVRRHAAILERDGADAAFDQRPPGVEVSYKILWEPEEMRERGVLGAYRKQQQELAALAAGLPRSLRVRYYAAELRNMRAYWETDVASYARQLGLPTMVLHGSNDREVPVAWGEEMALLIPGARLHVVQGWSHSLIIRSAEARLIAMAFMKEQEESHV